MAVSRDTGLIGKEINYTCGPELIPAAENANSMRSLQISRFTHAHNFNSKFMEEKKKTPNRTPTCYTK